MINNEVYKQLLQGGEYRNFPSTVLCDFGQSRLVGINGIPSLNFLVNNWSSEIPGPGGFHNDVHTRTDLILMQLCELPTTIACPGATISLDILKCIYEKMSDAAKQLGLPPARDLYGRTRHPNRQSHTFSSRGIIVRDIQSEAIVMSHVGGELNGKYIKRLETWHEGLEKDTTLMLHLENEHVQRRFAMHLQYGRHNGEMELALAYGVPHARMIGREGIFLRVKGGGDLLPELESIADGRDMQHGERILSVQQRLELLTSWLDRDGKLLDGLPSTAFSEELNRIVKSIENWQTSKYEKVPIIDRSVASSENDKMKLARWILPFFPDIVMKHDVVMERWGDKAVSEMRVYFDPDPISGSKEFGNSEEVENIEQAYQLPDSRASVMDIDLEF